MDYRVTLDRNPDAAGRVRHLRLQRSPTTRASDCRVRAAARQPPQTGVCPRRVPAPDGCLPQTGACPSLLVGEALDELPRSAPVGLLRELARRVARVVLGVLGP